MTDASEGKSAAGSFYAGALLLLCALAFYYLAVLRIDYQKTALLDLRPYPDATEYFAQAKALVKDRWPSIQIGYDKLPSRYPPGYPALMLPWLKILSQAHSVLAPFRTNQTIGLLLLLTVFTFYAYLAMPLTGGFATLLLVTLPGFFTFCRSSLSEISVSAVVVLAFMFAFLGLKEQHRGKIYLSAVLLGLSVNIRIQSLFFAPLLVAMGLFPAKETPLRRLSHCGVAVIVFVLAASPLLVLNTIQFHSPLKTGYGFWIVWPPSLGKAPPYFSIRYLPLNVTRLWNEFALRPFGYSAANMFGTGTYFVPAFVLLICVGSFFVRMDRFVLCALLSCLGYLAPTLLFAVTEARFYLPLFILSVAVAILPVTWAAQKLFSGRRMVPALAIFFLFAAACLGYPSRSGYNTVAVNRSQAWDALRYDALSGKSACFIAERHFLDVCGREPAIVLSDVDPVYLNALWPRWIVAAPIDEKHGYQFSKIWHYDQPRALALSETRRGAVAAGLRAVRVPERVDGKKGALA